MRYKKDLKEYPNRVILGSETFCKDAGRFMRLAEENPSNIGDFVWTGMDYIGEAGLGAWDYGDYAKGYMRGFGWLTSGCGRLDITGKELSEMGYTKVVYGIEPIRVAVVPPNYYGRKHSPSAWKMTDARDSWSWNGCDGRKTQVEVYAKASRIELYLNGTFIGSKKCGKNYRTYFMNVYPEAVEIADTELAYIRFKYTDRNGTLKPLARGIIGLDITGGTLLSFGHARPYNEDGYHNKHTDTYFGEALAVIKPEQDMIHIRATSTNRECDAVITVVPSKNT